MVGKITKFFMNKLSKPTNFDEYLKRLGKAGEKKVIIELNRYKKNFNDPLNMITHWINEVTYTGQDSGLIYTEKEESMHRTNIFNPEKITKLVNKGLISEEEAKNKYGFKQDYGLKV